jgi:hypothetical protein
MQSGLARNDGAIHFCVRHLANLPLKCLNTGQPRDESATIFLRMERCGWPTALRVAAVNETPRASHFVDTVVQRGVVKPGVGRFLALAELRSDGNRNDSPDLACRARENVRASDFVPADGVDLDGTL